MTQKSDPSPREKFDPAPYDKYAVDTKTAIKKDNRTKTELDMGLQGTFPASDPVSVTQPSPSRKDNKR